MLVDHREGIWISEESAAERSRFAWLVAAIFFLLTVPRLLLHELWRDEAWQWLVIIESHSPALSDQPDFAIGAATATVHRDATRRSRWAQNARGRSSSESSEAS